MNSEFPVYFELEGGGACGGGVHFFCSIQCRETAPTSGYNCEFKAGEQPISDMEAGVTCEACGKYLTAPEGVSVLRETVDPLDCPVCGAAKSFIINSQDQGSGYCTKEQQTWTIRPFTDKANPTALPWAITEEFGDVVPFSIIRADDTGGSIADVFGDSLSEAAANAQLIVRAVNSHSQLIAALNETVEALEAFERGCDCKGLGGCTQFDALIIGKEALAAIATNAA